MNKTLQLLLILYSALMLMLTTGYAAAEVNSKTAFLKSGPVSYAGAPGIGANLIPGHRGTYSLDGKEISVFFTRESVPVFLSWQQIESGGMTFHVIEEETLYFYTHRGLWTVFIDFTGPENFNRLFLEKFTSQLIFFARDGDGFASSSFPAVITL